MGYTYITKMGWMIDISIDLRQWVIGANCYRKPWPMWNVFIGPLRVGGCREFATIAVKA